MPAADDPVTHVVIQLSDPHLVDRATPHFHDVDPVANLQMALATVRQGALRPDLLLVTGDITDAGEAAAYRRAADIIDGAADGWGCPVMYLPGNHDDRATFAATLLGADGAAAARPRLQQRTVRGLRVVGLDSVVPGRSGGHLDAGQLRELAEMLRTPAGAGTILALHHPPIRTPVPGSMRSASTIPAISPMP